MLLGGYLEELECVKASAISEVFLPNTIDDVSRFDISERETAKHKKDARSTNHWDTCAK